MTAKFRGNRWTVFEKLEIFIKAREKKQHDCMSSQKFFPTPKKIEGGPSGVIQKICEKKSHKAEISCTKKFGHGRDSNPRPSAWQTSKNPQKIRSKRSYIIVAVSGSQLLKLIKSVT